MAEISKQALQVANNTDFPDNSTGYITPAILRSYNTDVIDSTVNQTVYTANSSSWNSSISQLNSFTASQQPSFNALNAFTASQLTINSGVNAATQSLSASIAVVSNEVDVLQTWSSSVNQIIEGNVSKGYATRFNFGGLISASITANVGGNIADITVNSDPSAASTASFNQFTSSTNQFTQSINTYTASLKQAISVSGTDASILGNLNVSGTISAYEVHTIIESSSVIYSSGSNILGDASNDVQTLNGTVNLPNGNLNVTGSITVTGNVDGVDVSTFYSNTNAYTASNDTKWNTIGALTGSYASTSSVNSLNAYTASNDTKWNTLGAATGSYARLNQSQLFRGNQTISGSLINEGPVFVLGGNALTVQANTAGSGSLYSNVQLVIDTATDPTNIYSTYQAVDSFNNGLFGVGINSYNSKDGGAATFTIQGGGNVDGDNTILSVNPNTPGTLKFWKPTTIFNSNVSVTGSTTLSNTTITGSLLTNGGATFGNTQAQYNSIELKTSNATYPGQLYNSIYINADDNGEYSGGNGVSTYTSFGSNPATFFFGGGNGNNADGGNTAIVLANGDMYIQKDTSITGSLTITGSIKGNVVSASINSSTASIDLNKGTYFTLTLAGATTTNINVINPSAGETAILKIITSGASATASFSSNVYQPSGSRYVPSNTGTDIITFAAWDSTNVYATAIVNMQ